MVRIWVASLHQKDQRRKYAGLFLLQKPKDTPPRVDSNSCGPALAFRREKSPGGAFLAARLAETPAPTKKTSVENTLVFFFCKNPKSHPRGWIRTAAARRFASRRAQKPQWGFFSSAARRTTRAHQKDQRIKNGSARKLNRKAVSFQASRGVLSGRKQKSTKKFKKRLTFSTAVV